MNLHLTGKRVLITAGAADIGRAIAEGFAAEGARVHVCDIDAAALASLPRAAGTADATAGSITGALCDVSDRAAVERFVASAAAQLGGLDVLVNNAGIQHVANIDEFPVEKWDAIIAINLTAVFHTTRLALPGMKARGWGWVINVASAHGLVASAGKSAYVAAKHGVVGMTKAVALETATTGVTANAICPGWVLTPLVQKQIDDRAAHEGITVAQASRELLAEKQPSLQFTTPEQLGELAVFLCSEAAANVRGQAWAMDGGWTAQ
jgi:3-hydroxybutyrate dehydrogenase